MSPLQILHEVFANSIIATVIGQMDESNVDTEVHKIYELIHQIPEGGTLILNFAQLEYMNSKSIGYTMDFYNKMNEKNGKLIIAEAQEQIQDILNVVGLSNVIPMVASVVEAKNQVAANSSGIVASFVEKTEEIPTAIPEVKPEFSEIVTEISQHVETKQSLSEKQEQALETFLNDDHTSSLGDNFSQEEEKKETPILIVKDHSSSPVQQTPTTSQNSEKEIPILAIALVVALLVVLLVLILK